MELKPLKILGVISGIGSMMVAAREKHRIVGNIEWRPYYHTGTFEHNFPGSFLVKNWDQLTEEQQIDASTDIDLVIGHPECFIDPNTTIRTTIGLRKISEIKVGDKVITHGGRIRPVVELKNSKRKDFDLYKIEFKHGQIIEVTGNHPIMIIRDGEEIWVNASELVEKDVAKVFNYEVTRHFFNASPIISIEKTHITEEVNLYNFSVLDDHSYIANGVVVHNCGEYSALQTTSKTKGCVNKMDIPLFMELIKKTNPKFFVADNLPGSLKSVPLSEWQSNFPDYKIELCWISNYNYGNSQKHRNRLFIVGSKKELGFSFVPGEFLHDTRLIDVIGDLPQDRDIPEINHIHKKKDQKMYDMGALNLGIDTSGRENKSLYFAEFLEHIPNFLQGNMFLYQNKKGEIKGKPGYMRIKWDNYANTITGREDKFKPNFYPFTIRERARIQGLPDDFFFVPMYPDHKEYLCQIKQTGKCMPIQFCKYITDQIHAFLNGVEFETSGESLLKPNLIIEEAKANDVNSDSYKKLQNAIDFLN